MFLKNCVSSILLNHKEFCIILTRFKRLQLGALEHTFRAQVHEEKQELISHLPKAMQETVHGYMYSTFDCLKIFESFDAVNLSRHNREAIGDLCGMMRPL